MGENDISELVDDPTIVESDRDGVSLDRWTKYGHDRLYINGGHPSVEPYIDLKTGDMGDTGTVRVTVDFDDDIVTVEIGREDGHGPHDTITISLTGDLPEADNQTVSVGDDDYSVGDQFGGAFGTIVTIEKIEKHHVTIEKETKRGVTSKRLQKREFRTRVNNSWREIEDYNEEADVDEENSSTEELTNTETLSDVEEGDIIEQQEGPNEGARYRVVDLFHKPWGDELMSIDVEPLRGEPHRDQVSIRQDPLFEIVNSDEEDVDERKNLQTDGGTTRWGADIYQGLYLAKYLSDGRYFPETQAKAYVLKVCYGVPAPDIAQVLDVSESRIYNAVSAADSRLEDMQEMLTTLEAGELPPPDECAMCSSAMQEWTIDEGGDPLCRDCLDEISSDGGSREIDRLNTRAVPVESQFGDSVRQRIEFRRETKEKSAPGAVVAFSTDVLPSGENY